MPIYNGVNLINSADFTKAYFGSTLVADFSGKRVDLNIRIETRHGLNARVKINGVTFSSETWYTGVYTTGPYVTFEDESYITADWYVNEVFKTTGFSIKLNAYKVNSYTISGGYYPDQGKYKFYITSA